MLLLRQGVIDLEQVFGSVALILNQLHSLDANAGRQGVRPGKSVFLEIAELKDENLTNPKVPEDPSRGALLLAVL